MAQKKLFVAICFPLFPLFFILLLQEVVVDFGARPRVLFLGARKNKAPVSEIYKTSPSSKTKQKSSKERKSDPDKSISGNTTYPTSDGKGNDERVEYNNKSNR